MNSTLRDESILGLAEGVLQQAKEITKYYQANNLAAPTFSPKSHPAPNTAEYISMRRTMKLLLEDLQRLVDGPTTFYREFTGLGYDVAAFQVALDFQFFSLVPAEGEISLENLAEKAGLDLDRTSRIMRLLITQRFFEERKPGFITHNSFSIAMQNEDLRSLVHYSYDEMLQASAEIGKSLKAEPYKSDGMHCAFKTRHGLPIFEYYAQHHERALRFAKAMAGYRKMENSVVELRENFPWAQMQGTVVDIGGGSGHVSMDMARTFPQLKFEVQDGSESMLAQGRMMLPEELQDRISFRQANFFEPQPTKGASVYLLRQCTHNWADADVIKMFRSVVPALEASPPETPLLINDIVLPKAGTVSRLKEREMRQLDIVMMVCFGAKQRTAEEFEHLLKQADARYEIRTVHDVGALGLVEVYLHVL